MRRVEARWFVDERPKKLTEGGGPGDQFGGNTLHDT